MGGQSKWQLDRHIPIAFIITVLLQTGAIVWFIAKMDSRIQMIEDVTIPQTQVNARKLDDIKESVIRLQTHMEILKEKVK
jgi:hypothetical protein